MCRIYCLLACNYSARRLIYYYYQFKCTSSLGVTAPVKNNIESTFKCHCDRSQTNVINNNTRVNANITTVSMIVKSVRFIGFLVGSLHFFCSETVFILSFFALLSYHLSPDQVFSFRVFCCCCPFVKCSFLAHLFAVIVYLRKRSYVF